MASKATTHTATSERGASPPYVNDVAIQFNRYELPKRTRPGDTRTVLRAADEFAITRMPRHIAPSDARTRRRNARSQVKNKISGLVIAERRREATNVWSLRRFFALRQYLWG